MELRLYYLALNSFDRAIEFNPDDAKAWYNRGLAANSMKLYKQAIASFNRSLALKIGSAEVVAKGSVALQRLVGLSQKTPEFPQIFECQSQDYLIWYNRGVKLGSNGNHSEAIACYSKVLQLQPAFVNAFYNQACCYALLGFADLALDNLQRAVEFMPNLYRELALTDSDLRGLRKQQRFEALIQG